MYHLLWNREDILHLQAILSAIKESFELLDYIWFSTSNDPINSPLTVYPYGHLDPGI